MFTIKNFLYPNFMAPLENLWVNMKLYPYFSTDQSSVKYCFEQN